MRQPPNPFNAQALPLKEPDISFKNEVIAISQKTYGKNRISVEK